MIQPALAMFGDHVEDKLEFALRLRATWKEGRLGGEVMPEDAKPNLSPDSSELWHYFTLGMSLNYQRNSYTLWKSMTELFNNEPNLFVPTYVASCPIDYVRERLVHWRVAIQPNRHTKTWVTICRTITEECEGDVRTLFQEGQCDVAYLYDHVRVKHRSQFPCLCGPKIFNYWLYVLEEHCNVHYRSRELITIAPDTHVMQASVRIGVVQPGDILGSSAAGIVADAWKELLRGTDLLPIDMHTPLWLWSRSGFPEIADGK